MTLASLDLLDLLTERFRMVFVSENTRQCILMESSAPVDQHPLAVKIDNWMQANRSQIRIRRGYSRDYGNDEMEPYRKSLGGILVEKQNVGLDIAFPYGVGESLLLAKRLGIPFYSDESNPRVWARDDHQVAAFSTVALARTLVKEGVWTDHREADVLVTLIKMNYRWVSFGTTHLNRRLQGIISACRSIDTPITSAALLQDDSMLTLMRWFGESRINPDNRAALAIKWWCSIIGVFSDWRKVLAACMIYPTDCYISTSSGSVLRSRILKYEREQKAAHVLSAFLWVAKKDRGSRFQEVWLAVKDCIGELFPQSQEVQDLILLELIPEWLYDWAGKDKSVDENQRTSHLVQISASLPYSDKDRFETVLTRLFSGSRP